MAAKLVILIRSNPDKSHRPAEAIRIAAGLGIGKNPLKVILSGESPRVLSPDEDDLIDIDIIEKFLPMMNEWNIPIYVDKRSLSNIDLKNSPYKFRVADSEETSELIAGGHYVMVF